MKGVIAAAFVAFAMAGASSAVAADYRELRKLNAPPPTPAPRLPANAAVRPVKFARVVVHPRDGEAWAIAYRSIFLRAEGDNTPAFKMMTWNTGASEGETDTFGRIFNEELGKAGFRTEGGESLFDDNSGSADLKVGVLIDDMKGRFCVDCPNLFSPKGVAATVVMTAHWEIYSALERRVVAKITTSGGADYTKRLEGSFLPAVFEGFRENVRQLLTSEDFRRVVTAPTGASASLAADSARTMAPIAYGRSKAYPPLSQAAGSVAIVYAADGQGSGFLISPDGYVLTNQHVVGGSKYVKLKWGDGVETLGEVIRVDGGRDVALIKTEAKNHPALMLRSGPVRQGEPVFAIGTPLDDSLQNTMTRGIVSAERVEQGQRFIQSDVGINHGNSGGPLLDEMGAVVGVAVSGILPNSLQLGLNFFIPIDDALKSLTLKPAA